MITAENLNKHFLLNVLSALVQPDEGRLFYNTDNLAAAPAEQLNMLRQSDFAVIFQFHHLLPYLTVLQHTLLPFMRSVVAISREIVFRAEHCLERIGLGGNQGVYRKPKDASFCPIRYRLCQYDYTLPHGSRYV